MTKKLKKKKPRSSSARSVTAPASQPSQRRPAKVRGPAPRVKGGEEFHRSPPRYSHRVQAVLSWWKTAETEDIHAVSAAWILLLEQLKIAAQLDAEERS